MLSFTNAKIDCKSVTVGLGCKYFGYLKFAIIIETFDPSEL